MRKFILLTSLVILAGCNLAYISSSKEVQNIRDRGVLLVGVKTDVPKLGYRNHTDNITEGFEIDIAKAIAKKILGEEDRIKLIPVSVSSREQMLDANKVDLVIATFTATQERNQSYNFSDVYHTDGIGLMVQENSNIKTFRDLNGKSVGIVHGATSKVILQEEAKIDNIKIKFFSFGEYLEVQAALKSNMVDCFAADRSILFGYQSDNTVILDEKLSIEKYGVASKKSNTALAKLVNETINELKISGELNKMAEKWGL
jgi:putative glutamine transport system substrate-binding protein